MRNTDRGGNTNGHRNPNRDTKGRSRASSRFLRKKLKFGTVTVNQAKTKMVKVTNAGKIKKKSLPILIEMESASGTPAPSPFSVSFTRTAGQSKTSAALRRRLARLPG
jgi:hypothetical protein